MNMKKVQLVFVHKDSEYLSSHPHIVVGNFCNSNQFEKNILLNLFIWRDKKDGGSHCFVFWLLKQ